MLAKTTITIITILGMGLELGFTGTDEELVTQAIDRSDRSDRTESNEGQRNGVTMSGAMLNDVDIAGPMTPISASFGDTPLLGFGVHGADFVAMQEVDGELIGLTGSQLINARMVLSANIGATLRQKVVADIVGVNSLEGTTLNIYHLLMYDAETISWLDPCPNNAGKGLIPLRGAWDPQTGDALGGSQVTFACVGDVLAKCVEWGYQPWESEQDAELHQACIRMVRADYCGDGTPMTLAGTKIDVHDALGFQDEETEWPFEAEWGPDGATCIAGNPLRLELLGLQKPDCLAGLETPSCGELAGESLLANRYEG